MAVDRRRSSRGAGCHRRGNGSGQVGRINDACCDLFDDSCCDDNCCDDNQEHCPVDDEDHDFVPRADDDNDRAADDDNHRGDRAAGSAGPGDHDYAVRSTRPGVHAAEDNGTRLRSSETVGRNGKSGIILFDAWSNRRDDKGQSDGMWDW